MVKIVTETAKLTIAGESGVEVEAVLVVGVLVGVRDADRSCATLSHCLPKSVFSSIPRQLPAPHLLPLYLPSCLA